jgi:phosphoglycolate phosphatase
MYLIFDFDGTLIDSFYDATTKFNRIADKFNLRKVDASEIHLLRDLSSSALIKYLQIPLYKLPQIIYQARKDMRHDLLSLTSFTNLPEVLQKLHQAGHSLGILTSNSAENVSDWLAHNKLQHIFSFLHSESSYFGKKRILKKIIRAYNIDKSHAYYVGDETRDIDAAKDNHIYSVAVTWGFNSEAALLQHHPDFIVSTPNDFLSLCGV